MKSQKGGIMSKTIAVIVSRLSLEEREKFKDLITECEEREKTLLLYSQESKKALDQLFRPLSDLAYAHTRLHEESQKLLDLTLDTLLKLSLPEKIPSA